MSPRYDVPNAAPAPLREVQVFVNSIDRENGVEWLPEWLAENGLEAQLGRARALRESLRALVVANNALPLETGAVEAFNAAAARLRLELDESGRARVGGAEDRARPDRRDHARCDARRNLVEAQGVPPLLLVVLRPLAEPLGRVVLDAALRQPRKTRSYRRRLKTSM